MYILCAMIDSMCVETCPARNICVMCTCRIKAKLLSPIPFDFAVNEMVYHGPGSSKIALVEGTTSKFGSKIRPPPTPAGMNLGPLTDSFYSAGPRTVEESYIYKWLEQYQLEQYFVKILFFVLYLVVSKNEKCWLWESWTRPEIPKSQKRRGFGFFISKSKSD